VQFEHDVRMAPAHYWLKNWNNYVSKNVDLDMGLLVHRVGDKPVIIVLAQKEGWTMTNKINTGHLTVVR